MSGRILGRVTADFGGELQLLSGLSTALIRSLPVITGRPRLRFWEVMEEMEEAFFCR